MKASSFSGSCLYLTPKSEKVTSQSKAQWHSLNVSLSSSLEDYCSKMGIRDCCFKCTTDLYFEEDNSARNTNYAPRTGQRLQDLFCSREILLIWKAESTRLHSTKLYWKRSEIAKVLVVSCFVCDVKVTVMRAKMQEVISYEGVSPHSSLKMSYINFLPRSIFLYVQSLWTENWILLTPLFMNKTLA